jgi:hypothetical protein
VQRVRDRLSANCNIRINSSGEIATDERWIRTRPHASNILSATLASSSEQEKFVIYDTQRLIIYDDVTSMRSIGPLNQTTEKTIIVRCMRPGTVLLKVWSTHSLWQFVHPNTLYQGAMLGDRSDKANDASADDSAAELA